MDKKHVSKIEIKYTFIIPVKKINCNVYQTIKELEKIKRNDFEVIILPNKIEINDPILHKIKLIETGRVGPAVKRDIGAINSLGHILVFIDDDSYPQQDILALADKYFEDINVVALGGPGITPKEARLWERVSGAIYLSKFSGGFPERYISYGGVKEVDDWPSVNLMVRKNEFLEIGGFNTEYWPGEDSKLCLNLINKTKKKILYIPNMIVWHHRRKGLLRHLKQVGAYGLHRGFFARQGDKNSLKLKYFIPALLLIYSVAIFGFLIAGIIEIDFMFLLMMPYIFILFMAWFDIKRIEGKKIATLALYYIILSHYYYGLRFIYGLSKNKLKSALR